MPFESDLFFERDLLFESDLCFKGDLPFGGVLARTVCVFGDDDTADLLGRFGVRGVPLDIVGEDGVLFNNNK